MKRLVVDVGRRLLPTASPAAWVIYKEFLIEELKKPGLRNPILSAALAEDAG